MQHYFHCYHYFIIIVDIVITIIAIVNNNNHATSNKDNNTNNNNQVLFANIKLCMTCNNKPQTFHKSKYINDYNIIMSM